MKKHNIHWNFNRGFWSCAPVSGRVMPEATNHLTLVDIQPKYMAGKFAEAHTKSKKTVCADIRGTLVEYVDLSLEGRAFTFNIWGAQGMQFIYKDTGLPFDGSETMVSFSIDAQGKPVAMVR